MVIKRLWRWILAGIYLIWLWGCRPADQGELPLEINPTVRKSIQIEFIDFDAGFAAFSIQNMSDQDLQILLHDTEVLYLEDNDWLPVNVSKSAIWMTETLPANSMVNSLVSIAEKGEAPKEYLVRFHLEDETQKKSIIETQFGYKDQ